MTLATLFLNIREFSIGKSNLDFTENFLPSQQIKDLAELEKDYWFTSFQELLDFGDSVEFAARKAGGTKKEKPKCAKGYPCGNGCISVGYNCKKAVKGQAKTYAEFLKAQSKQQKKPAQKPLDKKNKTQGTKQTEERIKKKESRLTPENLEALSMLGTIISRDGTLPSNELQIGTRIDSASRLLKDKRVDLLDRELGSEDIIDQHKLSIKEIENKYPDFEIKQRIEDLALDLIDFAKENNPDVLIKHKGHIHRYYKDIKNPTPVQTAIYDAINDIKNKKSNLTTK